MLIEMVGALEVLLPQWWEKWEFGHRYLSRGEHLIEGNYRIYARKTKTARSAESTDEIGWESTRNGY